MRVQKEIDSYIAAQPQKKRADMRALHGIILQMSPGCKLWFLDGKDSSGKTVSNPNIGYGSHTIKYADGTSRDFYKIGLSSNTAGISVYIIGIEDKKYLAEAFGKRLGKANVTGYCIRFKALKDIDVEVLASAIRFGFENQSDLTTHQKSKERD